MKLAYAKIDSENKSATMMLYGVIGEVVNGHDFARELNWLGQNYNTIDIRVNSDGGSISQGLSIVAEMLASEATINVHIAGVAASMAAVIPAAADKVTINDFAKVMVHSPYYVDEQGERLKHMSKKDKIALSMLKDTLVTLLTKRGIEKDEVMKMIRTDTWFTADAAKDAKLVDEVIVSGRKELAALSPKKLVAKMIEEDVETQTDNSDMKKLIAKFKLAETASEDDIMQAVAKMEADASAKVSKVVAKMIALGKESGTVTADNEAKFTKLAETDFDFFVDMLQLKQAQDDTRISDAIAKLNEMKGGEKKDAKASVKSWDWYQKNDPVALSQLETTNPEEFEKLRTEYEASL